MKKKNNNSNTKEKEKESKKKKKHKGVYKYLSVTLNNSDRYFLCLFIYLTISICGEEKKKKKGLRYSCWVIE